MKTLHLRVERQNANALRIATFLSTHPKVKRVNYPGLASHPRHEVAKKQMKGFGGMVSFVVTGGVAEGTRVCQRLKLIVLAVSLGGVESLIEHPASMTHVSVSKADRKASGISSGLLRLSVGVENVDDLIADLTNALSD